MTELEDKELKMLCLKQNCSSLSMKRYTVPFKNLLFKMAPSKVQMRDGIIEIGIRKDNLKLIFNYCLTTPSSSKKSKKNFFHQLEKFAQKMS